MRYCSDCNVDVSGDLKRCPLCHAKLTGEAEPSVFPRNVAKESGSLALMVLALVTGVCLLLMLFLGRLYSVPGDIVLAVCLALIMNYLFVRSILVHSPDFLRIVMRYFLILLAIAAVWYLVTRNPIVTTFVIPGICLLALFFDAVLVVVFRGVFVTGYAKYLLFNVFLGLTPFALVVFDLTTWDAPAYTSALAASIFLLVLAIFMRKHVIAELQKLFSA